MYNNEYSLFLFREWGMGAHSVAPHMATAPYYAFQNLYCIFNCKLTINFT